MIKTKTANAEIKEHLSNILGLGVTSQLEIEDFEETFGVQISAEEISKMTFNRLIAWQLAMRASKGDASATKEVFDRVIGRPKQTTENLNVNAEINDFFAMCEEDDRLEAIKSGALSNPKQETIDATFTEPEPEDDMFDDLGITDSNDSADLLS